MSSEISGPEQWIEQTQGLVRSLAYAIHRSVPRNVPVEDIIAYGQVGLLQAAQAYRSDYGTSFQTFAYHRIRGAIFDGLGKMAWTSRAAQRQFAAERSSHEVLADQHQDGQDDKNEGGKKDSPVAAAGWLFRTTEKLAVVQLVASGSSGYERDDGGIEDRSERPDEQVAQDELRDMLNALVKKLPEIERSLIELTYYEGRSFAEAARMLGHSKSWASRLHAQILQRLARSVNLLDVL
jgi:RNA polymerase sigma factor for flagellar operon FliA